MSAATDDTKEDGSDFSRNSKEILDSCNQFISNTNEKPAKHKSKSKSNVY
jgi:hypothetical protein